MGFCRAGATPEIAPGRWNLKGFSLENCPVIIYVMEEGLLEGRKWGKSKYGMRIKTSLVTRKIHTEKHQHLRCVEHRQSGMLWKRNVEKGE